MVERASALTTSARQLPFTGGRVDDLLTALELMAAGDTSKRLPISDQHDELDAIAYGINVLIGELGWATVRALEAQEDRAEELREAVAIAERANAAKNTFLRNLSHEIRTPIAAMLSFADLLAADDLSRAERADLVQRLRTNGQALLSLLGDLLDIARIDADKIVLTPESVSVTDLVQDVLASLKIEFRGKDLDVRVEVPKRGLATIVTDRYRLRQVLANLIVNAIKFTEHGQIVVSVYTARDNGIAETESGRGRVAGGSSELIIDVADTGIGIAPDRHHFLFQPFEQADSSIARKYGGTGLGLALSRRLAEHLGGTLTLLHSTPGAGSTFRLTVQPLSPTNGIRAFPPHTAAPETNGMRGLHILVAEDHPDMQLAVRKLLEQAGATVEIAGDGREAVAKARARSFDAVLMDLRMPHMDGLQATSILRTEGCTMPIIAITADAATLRRAEALAAGCDACLSKPFTLSDVALAIRRPLAPLR